MFEALEGSCAALGFHQFTLSCHKATGQELVLDATFTTVCDDYLKDYERLGWFDDDAVTARIQMQESPVAWSSLGNEPGRPRQQSFVDFLHAYHPLSGVAVALPHRPNRLSMLGMVSFGDRQYTAETFSAVKIIGKMALLKAETLGLCPDVSVDQAHAEQNLSDRQKEVLRWVGEGKSNADIAVIMGLKERAVRFHVSEILRKLGVVSRSQAVLRYQSGKV